MKKALVVGINHFVNYPESALSFCDDDADLMADRFEALGCNMGRNVIRMTDSQAMDFHIINQVQEFLNEAMKADSYYVGLWFSSHGSHYSSTYEADGLGEGLCTYNLLGDDKEWSAGFIKDRTWRNLLNRFPKTGIVEIGFDACYSWGIHRLLNPCTRKIRALHAPGNKDGQHRLADSTITSGPGLNSNIVLWAACDELQVSYDGAFTPAFAEVLQNHPEYSRVETLIAVRQALKKRGFDQLPRLRAWNVRAQARVGE